MANLLFDVFVFEYKSKAVANSKEAKQLNPNKRIEGMPYSDTSPYNERLLVYLFWVQLPAKEKENKRSKTNSPISCSILFLKMGHFRPLFLHFLLFNTVDST